MTRPVVFAVFFALVPAIASADAFLTIAFHMEDAITARFDCGAGGPLAVVYVASETGGLALVPVEVSAVRNFGTNGAVS